MRERTLNIERSDSDCDSCDDKESCDDEDYYGGCDDGVTALFAASCGKHINVCDFLLLHGAEPLTEAETLQARQYWITAFLKVVRDGQLSAVKLEVAHHHELLHIRVIEGTCVYCVLNRLTNVPQFLCQYRDSVIHTRSKFILSLLIQ